MAEAINEQKAELVGLLIKETRAGMDWKPYPDTYGAEWKGQKVYLENLRDGPMSLHVRAPTQIIGNLLSGITRITMTTHDSPEIDSLLHTLHALILDRHRPEIEAAAHQARLDRQIEAAATQQREAVALAELLS